MTAHRERTILYDTLMDLAASADRQAARAAEIDDTTASSTLFILGDELRTMAQRVKNTAPTEETMQLLDAGRVHIATSMVRFDAVEATTQAVAS